MIREILKIDEFKDEKLERKNKRMRSSSRRFSRKFRPDFEFFRVLFGAEKLKNGVKAWRILFNKP